MPANSRWDLIRGLKRVKDTRLGFNVSVLPHVRMFLNLKYIAPSTRMCCILTLYIHTCSFVL